MEKITSFALLDAIMSTPAIPLKIDDRLKTRVKEWADARESFKREAIDSWHHYQESGLHLTGDEINAWLRDWGIEAGKDSPECHNSSSQSEPQPR
ncbi:CopG family transcriptional regulator [Sodalis sp. C49]|uniref:CopG family transcriptional regulator n=1 Tax=unclassified Sodalis (in: enterobacteria) TaxID=2636512 RepID=UPI003965929E